jgi:hypothetical protein
MTESLFAFSNKQFATFAVSPGLPAFVVAVAVSFVSAPPAVCLAVLRGFRHSIQRMLRGGAGLSCRVPCVNEVLPVRTDVAVGQRWVPVAVSPAVALPYDTAVTVAVVFPSLIALFRFSLRSCQEQDDAQSDCQSA